MQNDPYAISIMEETLDKQKFQAKNCEFNGNSMKAAELYRQAAEVASKIAAMVSNPGYLEELEYEINSLNKAADRLEKPKIYDNDIDSVEQTSIQTEQFSLHAYSFLFPYCRMAVEKTKEYFTKLQEHFKKNGKPRLIFFDESDELL